MSAALGRLFDAAATAYDGERRALVPCFDRFYGAALDRLRDLPHGARVLDLGAGTGLFSGLLAVARPDVMLTLVDLAPAMLEAARARFEAIAYPEPVLVVGDYAEAMPEGPFDAVISALSIHHLSESGKAQVHRMAHDRLAPGGVFVNAEQIAGETADAEAALDREWEAAALALGASPESIARARERMRHDRCITAEANLALLRRAGLTAVRCDLRQGRFAVFSGTRSDTGQ